MYTVGLQMDNGLPMYVTLNFEPENCKKLAKIPHSFHRSSFSIRYWQECRISDFVLRIYYLVLFLYLQEKRINS